MDMQLKQTADSTRYVSMSTEALRASFMIESIFNPGQVSLALTDLDRGIVGSAVPTKETLTLPAPDALRASFFCERRELGVLNIGGDGTVTVDGQDYTLASKDCLYVGRGSREVSFVSANGSSPAKFYLLSYPAHADYPTTLVRQSESNILSLGSKEEANERKIYQYIHEGGARSCQLVLGFTELAVGSVWNTMPAHTHARRTEIYTYFNVPEGQQVLHVMGRPEETRNIWLSDGSVVLSPEWSIHCAAGTASYSFIWGMGGENQAFADMDGVAIPSLR